MSRPLPTETFMVTWRSVNLQINWKKEWLNTGIAHLEIVCVTLGAILPITETGYRSHFTDPETVMNQGGPVAFVLAWLDAESALSDWQKRDVSSRQLTLF